MFVVFLVPSLRLVSWVIIIINIHARSPERGVFPAALRALPPVRVAVCQNAAGGKRSVLQVRLLTPWSRDFNDLLSVSTGGRRAVLRGPAAGLHPHAVPGPVRLQEPEAAKGQTWGTRLTSCFFFHTHDSLEDDLTKLLILHLMNAGTFHLFSAALMPKQRFPLKTLPGEFVFIFFITRISMNFSLLFLKHHFY